MTERNNPNLQPAQFSPDLQAQTVIGVFAQPEQAEAAARALEQDGFPREEISLVFQQAGGAPQISASETKADRGVVTGTTTGALVGGALGLVALAIPGIGPLIVAGPLAAALSGAVVGGTLGGLLGSFVGLGIPTEQAREYEAAVREGRVIVAAKVPDHEHATRAGQLMEQHGAEKVTGFTRML